MRLLRQIRNSSDCMISRVCASSDANGSSINSTSGSIVSARARLARWRMPPDNSCGKCCSNPFSPTSLINVSARLRASPFDLPWTSSPKITLSIIVRHGNSPSCWNTKPRSGPGRSTWWPSTHTSPRVGGRRPSTIRSSVVLPQPEAPTREMNSPASTCSDTSRKASKRWPRRENCMEMFRSSSLAGVPAYPLVATATSARTVARARAAAPPVGGCSPTAHPCPPGETLRPTWRRSGTPVRI